MSEEREPADGRLELARRSADAMYAADLASQRAGVVVEAVAPGRASVAMDVRADMVNGHGICHGGYVFLLADSAFAFACNTYGVTTVAQAGDVTFLAPAHAGDRLLAEAVERARAGRSGVYDVTVRRAVDGVDGGDGGDGAPHGSRTGEVVAEFRGHSRAVPGLAFPGADDPREESSA